MHRMSLLLALILTLAASAACATVRTVSSVALTAPKVSSKGQSVVQYTSFENLEVTEGQDMSFAELTFEEALDPMTEVEIWPAIEGATEPWDVPEVVAAFGRNLWVVDERTGSFVKFDVTSIVKAWHSEALPNRGFEIRVIPAEVGAEGAGSGIQNAVGASKVTLRYFTHPNMKLDAPHDTQVPRVLPGHIAPVHEGSGNSGK